ncbi:DinB family protein [soil metagenome]
MRKLTIFSLLLSALSVLNQQTYAQTLKSVLVDELKATHNKKDWFVPINVALEGVTAEQAMWKDGSGNHSIGQLTYHLLFWNERQLATFKGEKESAFSGNNEETFDAFDKASWAQTVAQLDMVMLEIEKIVAAADDVNLKKWALVIANISTHNAYHTGQIVFVRKLQKSWDAEKGVK